MSSFVDVEVVFVSRLRTSSTPQSAPYSPLDSRRKRKVRCLLIYSVHLSAKGQEKRAENRKHEAFFLRSQIIRVGGIR